MKPVPQMSAISMFEYLVPDYAADDGYEFERDNHLALAALATLDELRVLSGALSTDPDPDVVRRMLLRVEDRLCMALRLEVHALEVAEAASKIERAPGTKRLFIADTTEETDAVMLGSLRPATKHDLAQFGYFPGEPTSDIYPTTTPAKAVRS